MVGTAMSSVAPTTKKIKRRRRRVIVKSDFSLLRRERNVRHRCAFPDTTILRALPEVNDRVETVPFRATTGGVVSNPYQTSAVCPRAYRLRAPAQHGYSIDLPARTCPGGERT